jgi:hypothetical protein
MSRFQFDLAGPDDDADLRHVLEATPMPGRITVRFQREPSWFAAAVVDGRRRQVVACRNAESGRVVGFGCRSIRDVYVNGRPATVGYLSSLRLLAEHRNRGLVARGYAFFRRLHEDGVAPLYLTTIAAGNETALRVLTKARAGLPAYHPAGMFLTLAIPLGRRSRVVPPSTGVMVRPAETADLPAILAFLDRTGPRRQFFPQYRREDFLSPEGLLRGLTPDRVLLAERAGRIVGTLGGWDQHEYRQSVLDGYAGALGWLRPVLNAGAWLLGQPGLPAPGSHLRYLTAALPVVEDDDPAVFAALLAVLRSRYAGGPWSHLMLGLYEDDPLANVARAQAQVCYRTHFFLACWEDGEPARAALDGRVPYLEVGSL